MEELVKRTQKLLLDKRIPSGDYNNLNEILLSYKRYGKLTISHINYIKVKLSTYEDISDQDKLPVVILKEGVYCLKLNVSAPKDLVQRVPFIVGCSYIKSNRLYSIPATVKNYQFLKVFGLNPPLPVTKNRTEEKRQAEKKEVHEIEIPPDFKFPVKKTLREYQKQGVFFLQGLKSGSGIIGDEMGLGKTLQSITYAALHPELWPVCVICPAGAKYNWENELKAALPKKNLKIHIITGRWKKGVKLPKSDFYIINYDILPNARDKKTIVIDGEIKNKKIAKIGTGWADNLPNCGLFIIDEFHCIGNQSAYRTKDIMNALRGKNIIALSGTPIGSRTMQLYPILSLVAPRLVPNQRAFGIRYCDGKHNGFAWEYNGSSNTEELYEMLKGIMIRRLKKDVLTELPDKIKTVIPIKLGTKDLREYKKAENDFANWIAEVGKTLKKDDQGRVQALALVKLQVLSSLVAEMKLKSCVELIKEFIELNPGKKIILWAVRKKIVTELMKVFAKYNPVKIDGSVAAKDRPAVEKAFQEDPNCIIFVGNIRAAGEAINLTACHTEFFLEFGQTPGQHDQAEDRTHRFGQKNTVNIYYTVTDETIEQRIIQLLDKKRKNITAVLDGKEVEKTSLLTELFKQFLRESKEV